MPPVLGVPGRLISRRGNKPRPCGLEVDLGPVLVVLQRGVRLLKQGRRDPQVRTLQNRVIVRGRRVPAILEIPLRTVCFLVPATREQRPQLTDTRSLSQLGRHLILHGVHGVNHPRLSHGSLRRINQIPPRLQRVGRDMLNPRRVG